MDTTNKHDWGLIIAGALLVICSMFFLFAPGLALVTITVIAGAAFLVSGIFDIVNYFRFRKAMNLSGWALAYAALDIVLGVLFLVNPLVSAGALAWFIGAFFIVFGVFEAIGAFKVRNMGVSMGLDAVLGHRRRAVRPDVLHRSRHAGRLLVRVHPHARRVAHLLRLEHRQGDARLARTYGAWNVC